MSSRFWLESLITDDLTELQGDQAHHAIHVMRLSVGDRLELFDGTGQNYQAEIIEIQKRKVRVRILTTTISPRKMTRAITVATAIPKGDRQRFLVEKLVELGVKCLIPLKTQRSVAVASDNTVERFQKWTIEACKQCQRDELMKISQQRTTKQLIEAFQGSTDLKFLAQPAATESLSAVNINDDSGVVVAIGPEGGFDLEELAAFENSGWLSVSLSPFVLRIETAAITASAVLSTKQ